MEGQAARTAALTTVIRLEGEFDISDRPRLYDAFAVAASSPKIIVDFTKTTYVDSSALECILDLRQTVQDRKSDLVLVGLHDGVRRVFRICQLEPLFDIRPGLDSLQDATLEASRVQHVTLLSSSMGAEPSFK